MTVEEAIKYVGEMVEIGETYDVGKVVEENRQLLEWLKELKQLREQTRWIPIRKMLPENKTYVLTTIHISGRPSHARSGWYQDGFFHNDNGDVWNATDPEVEAWMPLPEPYKAEGSGEV